MFYIEEADTIDHIEAFGEVEMTREDMYAEADYAYHDVQSDTVLLQHDAYVRQGRNEFWAERMWLNLRTEVVRMKTKVRGTLVRPKGDNS